MNKPQNITDTFDIPTNTNIIVQPLQKKYIMNIECSVDGLNEIPQIISYFETKQDDILGECIYFKLPFVL